MTSTIQPSRHPKWEAFTSNFKQSNYITDFWNWFMTLMSKAAEMVLFGTVLYSGYQLLPAVPHVPAPIDAAVFVIQQGALDIGGMGLLKLAKRAGLPKDSFPVRLGVALVVLMILNVALASIKHTLPMIPESVFVGIETLLLIARAIVAVLFGHAIHALREEYGESAITLKEASELQERIDELSSELARTRENFHQQLSSELSAVHENFHQQLSLELSVVRASFQEQLSSELSPLHVSIEHHQATLASLHAMQAHLRQLTSSLAAEAHKRPLLRALPPREQQDTQEAGDVSRMQDTRASSPEATGAIDKFDARTFVFACLSENPALKLSEIEQRARTVGQELSQPTASRYRKQFFSQRESPHESSLVKGVSRHESPSMKSVSSDESSSVKVLDNDESSAASERKVVGE